MGSFSSAYKCKEIMKGSPDAQRLRIAPRATHHFSRLEGSTIQGSAITTEHVVAPSPNLDTSCRVRQYPRPRLGTRLCLGLGLFFISHAHVCADV